MEERVLQTFPSHGGDQEETLAVACGTLDAAFSTLQEQSPDTSKHLFVGRDSTTELKLIREVETDLHEGHLRLVTAAERPDAELRRKGDSLWTECDRLRDKNVALQAKSVALENEVNELREDFKCRLSSAEKDNYDLKEELRRQFHDHLRKEEELRNELAALRAETTEFEQETMQHISGHKKASFYIAYTGLYFLPVLCTTIVSPYYPYFVLYGLLVILFACSYLLSVITFLGICTDCSHRGSDNVECL